MISKTYSKQHQMSVVILEDLVPKDHLLRKIDKVIDFSFIYEYVEPLYSNVGRPSIDPVILIKLALLNRLDGHNSMRRTFSEAQVNLAYRWFLGIGIDEKVPHFSDFSKTYTRKFSKEIELKDTRTGEVQNKTIFAIIFDEVLSLAISKKYIYAQHSYMDSTHIKASANKKKIHKVEVETTRKVFQDKLDEEINSLCKDNGYKIPKEIQLEKKEIKKSLVDEDCGVFLKGEHELQFAYLAQTACDLNGFVLAADVSPANLHDSTTFQPVFNEIINKFGTGENDGAIRSLGLDAGYKTPAICKEIIDSGITPLLPYTRPKGKKYNEENATKMGKKDFEYDKVSNTFTGPNKCKLYPKSIDRKNGYITYRSKKAECDKCKFRNKCLSRTANIKTLVRHVWQDKLDEANLIRLTNYHTQYYKERSKTIERVFADAKEKHGMRFTRVRGIKKVKDDVLLVFACMNLKKMANWAWV